MQIIAIEQSESTLMEATELSLFGSGTKMLFWSHSFQRFLCVDFDRGAMSMVNLSILLSVISLQSVLNLRKMEA